MKVISQMETTTMISRGTEIVPQAQRASVAVMMETEVAQRARTMAGSSVVKKGTQILNCMKDCQRDERGLTNSSDKIKVIFILGSRLRTFISRMKRLIMLQKEKPRMTNIAQRDLIARIKR